jgi:DNA-binding CsgD family transcriptional regulator
LIRTTTSKDPPEEVEIFLQDHYELSHSEARLAWHLTMTGALSTTIQDLGITQNTAKTHLRRIYEKTGAHTQLQLARLVHRIARLF